jgi:hypothetical protein
MLQTVQIFPENKPTLIQSRWVFLFLNQIRTKFRCSLRGVVYIVKTLSDWTSEHRVYLSS